MWNFLFRTFSAWNFRNWVFRPPGADPLTVVAFEASSLYAGGFEAVEAYATGFEALEVICEPY